MYRLAISTQRTHGEPGSGRRDFNGERAAETYLTVLTVVILGMLVGITAFTMLSVIPHIPRYETLAWQEAQFASTWPTH